MSMQIHSTANLSSNSKIPFAVDKSGLYVIPGIHLVSSSSTRREPSPAV